MKTVSVAAQGSLHSLGITSGRCAWGQTSGLAAALALRIDFQGIPTQLTFSFEAGPVARPSSSSHPHSQPADRHLGRRQQGRGAGGWRWYQV